MLYKVTVMRTTSQATGEIPGPLRRRCTPECGPWFQVSVSAAVQTLTLPPERIER